MRTTIDLPSKLLRQAKSQAAARGETLKSLFERAVVAELGGDAGSDNKVLVKLPLFGDPAGPKVRITARDLERALADDDLATARRGFRRR